MGEVGTQMYGVVYIVVPGLRSKFCESTRETSPAWKRWDCSFQFNKNAAHVDERGIGILP